MNTQKIALILIGVVIIVAGAWYFISADTPEGGEEDAIAIVNGEEISRESFETLKSQVIEQQGITVASLDAETQSQLDAQVVDQLVSQALLEQAVSASGVVASQEDIDAQVAATVAQFGGDEAFNEALAAEGLSEEEFRAEVGENIATQAYLEQELNLSTVSATDEEIETTYAQIADGNEGVPPLEDVRAQVEQSVIQQKQQALLSQLIERLRTEADIEILL